MADRNRPIDPPPVPRTEDPAAMAARLAAEAKARLAVHKPSGLAAMAPPPGRHASLAAAAPPPARPRPAAPPPSHDVEADEFSSPAADVPKKAKKARPVEATPTPPPAPLAARAAPRKLSAADAIRLAMEEEAAAASRPKEVAAPVAVAPAAPEARPAPAPAPARVAQSPEQVLRAVLPSASVASATPVGNVTVLRALFLAHRARGVMTHDLALVAAASVLVDAAARVPEGRLFALRSGLAGTDYAVFVDADRGAILAVLAPPDLYLAGL